jgi:hypothetical protein
VNYILTVSPSFLSYGNKTFRLSGLRSLLHNNGMTAGSVPQISSGWGLSQEKPRHDYSIETLNPTLIL